MSDRFPARRKGLAQPTCGRDVVYPEDYETIRTDEHGVARWLSVGSNVPRRGASV